MRVEALADGKRSVENARYNALVLKAFDDMTRADKREKLDRASDVQRAGRERL